jgi:hypothetical protein
MEQPHNTVKLKLLWRSGAADKNIAAGTRRGLIACSMCAVKNIDMIHSSVLVFTSE